MAVLFTTTFEIWYAALHDSARRVAVPPSQESSMKKVIHTDAAPKAIGTYSQAVRCGDTVYFAGQIGLDPATMQLVSGTEAQIRRVFENLKAVAIASGGTLEDIVKLNVYLTDLGNFTRVNEIMATYFNEPYPARAALGVASLPRGAEVEIDAVMVLPPRRGDRD
jgi:reactive intermediate/imine deaminase